MSTLCRLPLTITVQEFLHQGQVRWSKKTQQLVNVVCDRPLMKYEPYFGYEVDQIDLAMREVSLKWAKHCLQSKRCYKRSQKRSRKICSKPFRHQTIPEINHFDNYLYCSSIKQDSFSMNVVHCTRDARELRCIKCLFALVALVE